MVSQRVHEIGIRVALGARRRDIQRLIIKQGMSLVLIGMAIGLGAAFILTRLISGLLFEISATDTTTFVVLPLILAGVAVTACSVPAWRATKVNLLVALRDE